MKKLGIVFVLSAALACLLLSCSRSDKTEYADPSAEFTYRYTERDGVTRAEIVQKGDDGAFVPLDAARPADGWIVVDGTTYSADGRTLYRWGGAADTFILPENVLFIAPGAFEESTIRNVQFNTALRYVGCFAFYQTEIESVLLPDSVRFIDFGAFACCRQATDGYIPEGCHVFYGFRQPSAITDVKIDPTVAPFYREKYADAVFPGEPLVSPDCLFTSCERKLSLVSSPGSDGDENWQAWYYDLSPLEDAVYNCSLQRIGESTGVLVFHSWYTKTNVLFTSDGGITWVETDARPEPTGWRDGYAYSCWVSERIGLLVYENVIAEHWTGGAEDIVGQFTSDGGQSWRILYRGDLPCASSESGWFESGFCLVRLNGESGGLRLSLNDREGGVFEWISTDGGVSWEEK